MGIDLWKAIDLRVDKPMNELPPLSPPVKHSVTINGHRTSVSLEAPFWVALKELALREERPIGALITQIDHARPADVGLATALRLVVLADIQG